LEVEAVGLDEAYAVHALGGSGAEGPSLLGGDGPHLHRPGLPDHLVRAGLRGLDLLGGDGAVEVDRGRVRSEVEPDRPRLSDLDEGLGEQVLAVV
jgi:hypothetical protein